MSKKSKAKVVSLEAHREEKKAKKDSPKNNFQKNDAHKSDSKKSRKVPISREKAFEDYQGLIKWVSSSIAAKCRHFVNAEDLASVGAIGLLKAMEMYDPKKNTQFRTYAVIKIRGEILDYIRKNYPRPVSQQIKGREYVVVKEALQLELHRDPTIEEIAEKLGVTVEETHTMADMAKQVQFVDWDSVAERGKNDETDMVTAYNHQNMNVFAVISRKQIREQLEEIMKEMPENVSKVIQHLYFEDLSQIEVAEKLKLSPSRVSQLHSEGIAMLQEKLSNNLVAEALQAA